MGLREDAAAAVDDTTREDVLAYTEHLAAQELAEWCQTMNVKQAPAIQVTHRMYEAPTSGFVRGQVHVLFNFEIEGIEFQGGLLGWIEADGVRYKDALFTHNDVIVRNLGELGNALR